MQGPLGAMHLPCTVTKLHGEAILADDLRRRTTSVDLLRTADGRSVSGVPLAGLRAPGACLVPLWQLETVRWFILGTCDQQSPLHRLRGQSWLLAAVVELLELHQVLADNLIGVLFTDCAVVADCVTLAGEMLRVNPCRWVGYPSLLRRKLKFNLDHPKLGPQQLLLADTPSAVRIFADLRETKLIQ